MWVALGHHDCGALGDHLRDAYRATPELFSGFIEAVCQRLRTAPAARAARIEQLIEAQAWTDAALALIELELPQWQLRRIAYDGGEWHCALSRQRELPDWLDQSIEASHPDLALAILGALVETKRVTARSTRPSVPSAPLKLNPSCVPACCDNFA